MIKPTLFALFFLILSPVMKLAAQPVKAEKQAPITEPAFPKAAPAANYTYWVLPAEAGSFGFEILQDNRALIKQTTIPGQPGIKGFASNADAAKVAELMISKLKRGEMPPSVTTEELKKLKVIR